MYDLKHSVEVTVDICFDFYFTKEHTGKSLAGNCEQQHGRLLL